MFIKLKHLPWGLCEWEASGPCVRVCVFVCVPHSPSDHFSKSKIIRSPPPWHLLMHSHRHTVSLWSPPHKGLIGFRSGDVREPVGAFDPASVETFRCWSGVCGVLALKENSRHGGGGAFKCVCAGIKLHNCWMSQHRGE